MKIAVLSDVHGNYIALQKCIDYVLSKGVDTFIFLGDYVGELAYPQKTMEIIYSLKEKHSCFFVKGNKEDYWLDYRANGEKVIEDLYISGLVKKAPAWCKVSEHLLRTGEISHGTVLAKAMELCGNELGECNWPNVPEKYWDLAVKEMIGE